MIVDLINRMGKLLEQSHQNRERLISLTNSLIGEEAQVPQTKVVREPEAPGKLGQLRYLLGELEHDAAMVDHELDRLGMAVEGGVDKPLAAGPYAADLIRADLVREARRY